MNKAPGNPASLLLAFLLMLFVNGCATPVPSDPRYAVIDDRNLPKPDFSAEIPGLAPCTNAGASRIHLNSQQPAIVIVHGCFGSGALFRALAEVFAFHGQQAVCFNYNDRDSLTESSNELITALEQLGAHMPQQPITIIGHSQGGLISRRALIEEPKDRLDLQHPLSLVTVSAPYSGIAAANHCGSPRLRWLSLGLVPALCRVISGDKWFEITYASEFIQKPGVLLDQVDRHLKIVTDEAGTCRRLENGKCVEDDYVFSLEEQYFDGVDQSPIVENVEVAAGHAEIVGNYQIIPEKLIRILQQQGVMHSTPPERREELISLLRALYFQKISDYAM